MLFSSHLGRAINMDLLLAALVGMKASDLRLLTQLFPSDAECPCHPGTDGASGEEAERRAWQTASRCSGTH